MKNLSIRARLVASYIIIALAVILITAFLTYQNTSSVMTNKVGVLTTAINDQMRLNVDNFLEDIEDVCALAFADQSTREYSPATSTLDEYDQIQLQGEIEDRLLNNSLLHNLGDFGIVYSDDSSTGRISSNTASVLSEGGLYQTLSSHITNDSTVDGWFTGVQDSYQRLYYVKQVNENAILLTSTYTAELETVLEFSDQLEDMRVRIITDEGKVIYSTVSDEIGTDVDADFMGRYAGKGRTTFLHDGALVAVSSCGDSWNIVSDIPTATVLKELGQIRNLTFVVAALSVLLALVIGIFFSRSITRPILKLMQAMERAESGDMTSRADFPAFGELSKLVASFNAMMDHIRDLLHQVGETAGLVEQNADEIRQMSADSMEISKNITTAMEGIAQGAQDQLEETQSTFDSLENLAESISRTVGNVNEVNERSKETRAIGEESIEQVGELKEKTLVSTNALLGIGETFDSLAAEVHNIEGVLEFILSVSDETNLLSLNASIEAARAGEAGRGFAVVADAVSSLAAQTKTSTEDINRVIRKIRSYVDETMQKLEESRRIFEEQSKVVEQTIESFERIVSSNDTISDRIGMIGGIAEDMSGLKDKSLEATRSILSITENASANTEEVMSATIEEYETSQRLSQKSDVLKESVEQLKGAMSRFKLDGEGQG